MPTAVQLLAYGRPVTVDDLAAAAGAEVDDLRNAPAGQDIEYDDQCVRPLLGGGNLRAVSGSGEQRFLRTNVSGLARAGT